MGINLEKMRAKLASLQSKGGNNNFWKPQDGEQTIRIVPTSDGDPFKDYWFHYNLGKNNGFLSPKKNSWRGNVSLLPSWFAEKKTKVSVSGALERWLINSFLNWS